MLTSSFIRWLSLFLVMLFTFNTGNALLQAQDTCVTPDVINTVRSACVGLEEGEACYGSGTLSAAGRNSDFSFTEIGNRARLEDLESLTLTASDAGVVVLRLHANLPDNATAAVLAVAFGDVQLQNLVPSIEPVRATLTMNGRVRSQPFASSDANIITALASGVTVPALGRNQAGDWLIVPLGDTPRSRSYGWVSTQVLQVEGNVSALPVLEADVLVASSDRPDLSPAPMSNFMLSATRDDSSCMDIPVGGLLIQATDNAGGVSFIVNQVNLSMTEMVYLAPGTEQTLDIYVLSGRGVVVAGDTTQLVPAGTMISVPLDDANLANGAPSAPAPYDNEFVAIMPVQFLSASGAAEFTPALAVAATQVEAAIQAEFAPNGVFEGLYAGVSSFSCPAVGNQPAAGTPERPSQLFIVIEGDMMSFFLSEREPRLRRVNETLYRGAEGQLTFEITILSPTQIRYHYVSEYFVSLADGGQLLRRCTGGGIHNWVSP